MPHASGLDNPSLRAKQVDVLFQQTHISLLATSVTALALVSVLWPYTPMVELAIWFMAVMATVAARFALVLAYERASGPRKNYRVWLAWYRLAAAIAGFIWGAAGSVLLPDTELLPQVFTLLFIGGLLAGAIGAYAIEIGSFAAFVVSATVPMVLHFFARGDTFGDTTGGMILVFTAGMSLYALRLNKTLLHGLRLQFQNASLVAQLECEKSELEHLRSELEQRVIERTAVLEKINWQLEGEVARSRSLTEELSYQASHDALTGLVNRRVLEERLRWALTTAQTDDAEHVLCYLDLDRFKMINDTCGHFAGDELLRQVSQLLLSKIRKHDTLARLGGDEFGILMQHCSLEQAQRLVRSLYESIRNFRFLWEGKGFTVGLSMGIVPITAASADWTYVLKQADAACYEAKDQGRNRAHIVYRQDDLWVVERQGEMQWVAKIEQALADGSFCLYYQTIAPLGNTSTEGIHYEVLLRMIDSWGDVIGPGAFMGAAERYSLSVKLDRWVVHQALQGLSHYPDFVASVAQCSINLSGHSLGNEEFREFVVQELQRYRVPPEKICFEITETAAITNLTRGRLFMNTLRNLGCRFALDDFGTGLSSFAYLRALPVDYLKIDGAFVQDIVEDPIAFAMVKSINEIGQVMGKKTVAEYVANDAIMAKVSELGVDYAQGYGISIPRRIEELFAN